MSTFYFTSLNLGGLLKKATAKFQSGTIYRKKAYKRVSAEALIVAKGTDTAIFQGIRAAIKITEFSKAKALCVFSLYISLQSCSVNIVANVWLQAMALAKIEVTIIAPNGCNNLAIFL